VRESRDPNVKMVLFEDTAAPAGIVNALGGILIDQLTGSSVFDPAASIAIGLLLIAVAIWMAHDTSARTRGSWRLASTSRMVSTKITSRTSPSGSRVVCGRSSPT
jgi:hypothetical protein